jgi:hypothetical protein
MTVKVVAASRTRTSNGPAMPKGLNRVLLSCCLQAVWLVENRGLNRPFFFGGMKMQLRNYRAGNEVNRV